MGGSLVHRFIMDSQIKKPADRVTPGPGSIGAATVRAREKYRATDGHGFTRIQTSVSIRVHPWLKTPASQSQKR